MTEVTALLAGDVPETPFERYAGADLVLDLLVRVEAADGTLRRFTGEVRAVHVDPNGTRTDVATAPAIAGRVTVTVESGVLDALGGGRIAAYIADPTVKLVARGPLVTKPA